MIGTIGRILKQPKPHHFFLSRVEKTTTRGDDVKTKYFVVYSLVSHVYAPGTVRTCVSYTTWSVPGYEITVALLFRGRDNFSVKISVLRNIRSREAVVERSATRECFVFNRRRRKKNQDT